MKQKLSRLLNTEFSWIELQLGDRKLQNDQVNDFLIYRNVDKKIKIPLRSLASLVVNKMVALKYIFQLLSLPMSWMHSSRCPHSVRKKRTERRQRITIRSHLMLSLLDNHTTLGQDLFTSQRKIFLKKMKERAQWAGLKICICIYRLNKYNLYFCRIWYDLPIQYQVQEEE